MQKSVLMFCWRFVEGSGFPVSLGVSIITVLW